MSQPTTSAPPAPGPHAADEGPITFTLYAPDKQHAALVGSFNNWDADADPMKSIGDGLWTLSKELPAGEHRYRFVVDDRTITDPYAREVAPDDDGDEDDAPAAVVRVGDKPFEWKHDGWQRPGFADLVIYELHIADFTAEGTFEAARQRLDHVEALGVNAIQLMPVNETQLTEGWGYQPTHYFAPRQAYGSPDDLRRFVDDCHRRGIAVILDLVIAHSGPSCPLNQLYDYDQSPWYGEGIGGQNHYGLPTFDHRKPPTQAFAHDVQRYWFDAYHVDGFRYDYAINIGFDGDNGLPRLARDARAARADAYLIGEYLPEDPKRTGATELNAAWHVRSSFALKCLAMQRDHQGYGWGTFEETVKAFDPGHEGYDQAHHMINYIESHDEQRLVHEIRDAGASGDAARRRLALAATLLLTAPGVPMVYHGQEFGEAAHLGINERIPLRWDLLATTGGKGLRDYYAQLIDLRRRHPALRAEGFRFAAVHNDEKWLVLHRWNDEGDEVVAAMNFGDAARTINVPLPKAGAWRDVLRDRLVERGEDEHVGIELQPSEAAILVPA